VRPAGRAPAQHRGRAGRGLARRDGSFRINGPRDAVERTVALLDALYEKADAPIGERACD
jgi:hypothetical protein